MIHRFPPPVLDLQSTHSLRHFTLWGHISNIKNNILWYFHDTCIFFVRQGIYVINLCYKHIVSPMLPFPKDKIWLCTCTYHRVTTRNQFSRSKRLLLDPPLPLLDPIYHPIQHHVSGIRYTIWYYLNLYLFKLLICIPIVFLIHVCNSCTQASINALIVILSKSLFLYRKA